MANPIYDPNYKYVIPRSEIKFHIGKLGIGNKVRFRYVASGDDYGVVHGTVTDCNTYKIRLGNSVFETQPQWNDHPWFTEDAIDCLEVEGKPVTSLLIDKLKEHDKIKFRYVQDVDYGIVTGTVEKYSHDGKNLYVKHSKFAKRKYAKHNGHYMFAKDSIKEISLVKLTRFEEDLEKAKAMIGKKVKFKSGVATVSTIAVIIKGVNEPITQRYWREDRHEIDTVFDRNGGWLIEINGGSHINILENVAEHIPNEWDDIRVNGYQAEKQENQWKFGCAQISFDTILDAKKLMDKTVSGCKKVESITIGTGTFTKTHIDILAKHSH